MHERLYFTPICIYSHAQPNVAFHMRRAAIFLHCVTVTLVSHSFLGRGIVSTLALESVSLNEMRRLIRQYLTARGRTVTSFIQLLLC